MTPERKVVVITGASRGIGAQLSKAYRQIGYQVIANSRSMPKSDDPAILAIEGDISLPETAERILGTAAERFGRIDTLVNNAGVFIAKPFTEYSEGFATMIAVNLAGFFHLSQKAAAWMLRMGSGHIVNITATIAEQPVVSLVAALAALTKGGLNAITRSLAIEYASRHVRVNAVSPGAIKTPMHPPEAHDFLSGL
jgi:NAD(P)-dependent dehydrogenase (short-subunit alcohol dehydrogenase family)